MNVLVQAALRAIDVDMYVDHKELYQGFMTVLLKQMGHAFATDATANATSIGQKLSYAETETMALHLSLQLQVLEERGFSLLFWQLTDILPIKLFDRNKKDGGEGEGVMYLLVNLSQLVSLHKKNTAMMILNYPTVYPFPKDVCAPEVLAMETLPFITYKGASYYSLALLCLKASGLTLEALRGTKLYYFLKRCLKEQLTPTF